MKVKCIVEYHDKELNKNIKPGDEFEVSDARGKVLVNSDVCVTVTTPTTEVVTETATLTPEVTPKKATRKKKQEGQLMYEVVDKDNVLTELEGDGDFASDECVKLLHRLDSF